MTVTPPEATPASMGVLVRILRDRGVHIRVNGDRLQIADPAKALTAIDRGVLKFYRDGLIDFFMVKRCIGCGAVVGPETTVFRTDSDHDLLERCIACGCTWAWGDPADVVLPAGARDTIDEDGFASRGVA
ncbi:hypothetical protein Pla108_40850 [Botrimarina colliarenosi]|uniref:TubC N-terminal docking domain-containing protein n=1 Tax=Botrimarina colliarenosi TaxID=2528001 RepID=A0A5C5ZYV6_9BACT|nr:hypothetical protein [Botrimarina colliarenosi]TWT92459.1 hypothetical protein Pla108_40850 [Botrimarina colliarenosi]